MRCERRGRESVGVDLTTILVEPDSQHKADDESESSSGSLSVITPLLPGPDMPPSYSRLISLTPGLLAVSPPPYQDAIKVDTLEQILTSARETQLL